MTNVLRGVGSSPDFALYGGSPQAVKDFQTCTHDGCLTVAVLFRSPKTENDPTFKPCFELRYHNGDCTPGGYEECPSGGPVLTKEQVQACVDEAIAPLLERIDALESAVAALTERLDLLEPVVQENAECVAELKTPAVTDGENQ